MLGLPSTEDIEALELRRHPYSYCHACIWCICTIGSKIPFTPQRWQILRENFLRYIEFRAMLTPTTKN